MKKKATVILLAGSLLAGCSPESYKRSADLQVNEILRDRKQETLSYQPQVEAKTSVPTKPVPPAFNKVPLTSTPRPTTSPMEPEQVKVLYGPLGPESKWMDALDLDPLETVKLELQRKPGRLVLGPPSLAEQPVRLDLFGCIGYGVQHSRAYQDQMEQLYLAALDVTLQRHAFDLRPFVTLGERYTGGQADVNYRSALAATATAGVRQKLPYGGEIVAQSMVEFVQAVSGNVTEGESASAALSGTIPLLRGAGWVNLNPLISAERQVVYQVRAFEDFRRAFAVSVASQYFGLLRQQASVANRRLNVANLASLTERTEALYAAGRLNFLEVQRSLQSLLQAQNDLINVEQGYQTALDDFKLVLGMPVEQDMDVVRVSMQVDVPRLPESVAVDMARKYRLDLQTARDGVEDAQRAVQVARNQLLPGLDLNGQTTITNEPGTPAVNFEQRTLTYAASVTLDLPVDRVAERNDYRRSLIQLERAQRQVEQLSDTIAADVREALRLIRTAVASLEIQRRGIELAERRLANANELLRMGRSDARNVVEAQSSLLDAQDQYEQALSDLQIRVLQYLQRTGTLRVDPQAGAIGRAMDRVAAEKGFNQKPPIE